MKRPPSCGCGCSCRSIWTPGDNVQREQWLYDAALVLDNSPIEDALTAPFAIPLDGLPTGPKPMDGGVRAFGPTPAGQDPTGWGYFNVNPYSVRFQTYLEYGDQSLETIDPLFAIKRAAHEYPDPDLHDNPRRGHTPFNFATTQKICQWQTGFGNVVHESDYLVGEIPEAVQTITFTFDDMYFRPSNWYVDRIKMYKIYWPIGRYTTDLSYRIPPLPPLAPLFCYGVAVYSVYFNSNMGIEAVPITSVPKSECYFVPQHPQHANIIFAPGEWIDGNGFFDTATLTNTHARSEAYKRDNLMPGWKITTPEINAPPHVGRTIKDSIDIYSYIRFDSGHWEVVPTIASLKCDAQLCHYYTLAVSGNGVILSPPDNSRIGEEAILPLVSGPVIGTIRLDPIGFRAGYYEEFATTDPTTGIFIKALIADKMPQQVTPEGGNFQIIPFELAWIDKADGQTVLASRARSFSNPLSVVSEEYLQEFLDSFESGDVFEIPRMLATDIANPMFHPGTMGPSDIRMRYIQYNGGSGYYQLPAFLGEQDVTYTFEPQSTRILDISQDRTTLAATKTNSQIPADGYEHTMTDAEQALYRQAADPVTIPLEVKEITHALDTRITPPTTVVDAVAVCFHSSWGGTPPNYDYPPHSGLFQTKTHSVPGATIVRETI